MKKYIIIAGICSSFILTLFLFNFQVNFQQEYFYEVSSDDDDVERHGDEEENKAHVLDCDIEVM